MGKKKNAAGLGRTLIKSRFGSHNRTDGESFLHTSELNDGYDWGRLNLQSVTEQNNLEEFLATAELAGTEFTAEKLNVKFISQNSSGLPQEEELARIAGLHKQHENLLRIPRRPPWTTETPASELEQNERQSFLEWRRTLAALQDVEGLVMTPYEKNLDFWRQLWRVIERSDVVVQIVDARNPLLFFCGDLETYVAEVGANKMCVVLINKADYLDPFQRDAWADYFTKRGVRVAFWSAVLETERQEAEKAEESAAAEGELEVDDDSTSEEEDQLDKDMEDVNIAGDGTDEDAVERKKFKPAEEVKPADETGIERDDSCETCDKTVGDPEHETAGTDTPVDNASSVTDKAGIDKDNSDACGACGGTDLDRTEDNSESLGDGVSKIVNTGRVYTGPELVEFLRNLHTDQKVTEGRTTVGMVGYPNVGKSSTINAILKMKKVPVSATPGRTKHFQTLYVDAGLMLCDCPGLVFPSFVTTKADLVVNGILPIDQMRDHVPPTSLICTRIPRGVLEKTYGIMVPKPAEGEDPSRPPTAHELLNAYGAMRGYMTARGQPDGPRSSRYVLKDYVNGKLLYCHPPPNVDVDQFNNFNKDDAPSSPDVGFAKQMPARSAVDTTVSSKVDSDFFRKDFSKVHQRTARAGGNDRGGQEPDQRDKPWKKHNNRNKKEKMRRVYSHLDG